MKHKIISVLTLIISLALIILIYPKLQNPTLIQAYVTQWGSIGIIIDLFVITLLMLFPVVPFVLIAGANTLLYGWVFGFILSLAGSIMGASLGFYLSRTIGQKWAQKKADKLGKWGRALKGNSFFIVLVSRLIPILPSTAINYAAGLSLMTFPSFFFATLIGKIPMILWESWIGHDFWLISHNTGRLFLGIAIGTILFGSIGLISYYSKIRFKQSVPHPLPQPEK